MPELKKHAHSVHPIDQQQSQPLTSLLVRWMDRTYMFVKDGQISWGIPRERQKQRQENVGFVQNSNPLLLPWLSTSKFFV